MREIKAWKAQKFLSLDVVYTPEFRSVSI